MPKRFSISSYEMVNGSDSRTCSMPACSSSSSSLSLSQSHVCVSARQNKTNGRVYVCARSHAAHDARESQRWQRRERPTLPDRACYTSRLQISRESTSESTHKHTTRTTRTHTHTHTHTQPPAAAPPNAPGRCPLASHAGRHMATMRGA